MNLYGIKQQDFKAMYETVDRVIVNSMRKKEYEVVEGIGKTLALARDAMEDQQEYDGPTYVVWLPTHSGLAPALIFTHKDPSKKLALIASKLDLAFLKKG